MPDGRLIRLWLFDQELLKYDVNLGGFYNSTGDLGCPCILDKCLKTIVLKT